VKGRYATSSAFKAAVEQRLRNEVKETSKKIQNRRQLLVFDRYLARVFRVFEAGVSPGKTADYVRPTQDLRLEAMASSEDD
jgi:hypothetical protein